MKPAHEPRRSARSLLVSLACIAALVVLDLWSKAFVLDWMDGAGRMRLVQDAHSHGRFQIFGEWFALMVNYNYGAAFGQFEGIPRVARIQA